MVRNVCARVAFVEVIARAESIGYVRVDFYVDSLVHLIRLLGAAVNKLAFFKLDVHIVWCSSDDLY